MKVACLQFTPTHKNPSVSLSRADDLLQASCLQPDDVDFLVLPEMAFSGYTFHSKAEIAEVAEDDGDERGMTVQWARRWARRLKAYVQVGYPRRISNGPHFLYYNAVLVISPAGTIITRYNKHFLYTTDENWAEEGERFTTYSITIQDKPIKVGPGICMDINPKRFLAPFDAYEFANFQVSQNSDIIICSMAWLLSGDAPTDEDVIASSPMPHHNPTDTPTSTPVWSNVRYWAVRLMPLVNHTERTDKAIVVVVCNRTGVEEDVTFCGSSTVMKFKNGAVEVLGTLGWKEKGVLIVET
ncbi:N-terminal asparagine amidohydrolase-like protein [Gaertneriomyces semiglobifer]|nr:N-terminal asparagine amidohydrolase-like protein [Gaertneriomyces semiglobifer]